MDIEDVASTLTNEFTAAVKAAQKAKHAAIDQIQEMRQQAAEDRAAGLARVRQMREDAGRLIAESLREEERIEAHYRSAQSEIDVAMNELRGPQRLAAPKKAPKLAAVSS